MNHLRLSIVVMAHLFSACRCDIGLLVRVPRTAWMRLLPARRLYRCAFCGKAQLLSQHAVQEERAAARSMAEKQQHK
ncbi:hypothetical protein QTI51_36950 [Variovorax sp. J22G73]|uniref:hypothetical protein n=1 Tax=unclassified Variovorax TaxID=663243 RepID=UPI0025749637|nr:MULTISPECIES: hypothetical protein [unclassified Variovorax]MDM0010501.1 hypothetical protein [Variovorax sp. J22R203]MDM0102916.1 hypothetical protein [Variovorax sp. J22G73]